jgi:DNA-binding FadR family transcriptional regulator
MSNNFQKQNGLSEFLNFLANNRSNDDGRIPPLSELSKILGVSVATLREQMEVARSLGLIAVYPKKGIHRLPYTFKPAVLQSLNYTIALRPDSFLAFADLRKKIEIAYWNEAVSLLTADDKNCLKELVNTAEKKIDSQPVQVPQREHRELHLLIYRRLDNIFVTGLLEAYWDAYESHGLHLYNDRNYLVTIWQFHRRMMEAIVQEDNAAGFQYFLEHVELITLRKTSFKNQNFE